MNKNTVRAMTFLEMIVVLVIVALFAKMAVGYLQGLAERSRATEAKNTLIKIRTAYRSYMMEHKEPPQTLAELDVEGNLTICNGTRFFSYSLDNANDHKYAIASRCRNKSPRLKKPYDISIDLLNGTWSGTRGFY